MADVCITEFTDPGCPWAFSAEPFRARLRWLYGDRIEWKVCLVGLAASPEENEQKGMTAAKQARGLAKIAREHGMPIDTSERSRAAATVPACLAIVAARIHAPDAMRALLRSLRVRAFAGELLDASETIDGAARDAGIDPAALATWLGDDAVEAALREDMDAARKPLPAARVLDHKLANWSGGRRYTCPSYEILRRADDVRIAVPGFQPFAAYDVVLANLVPGMDRRADPESVAEVLEWAGTELASKEVAVVCDTDLFSAREALGRVARERPVGADGYWSLSD